MNFVLSVVFQFILVLTKKRFTYKHQLYFSFFISILALVSLPIVVVYLKDLAGFLVTCLIMLIQGLANAIILSCIFGIVSYLPFTYIIALSTGQGIAGILMNIIRYIFIIIFGVNSKDEDAIIKSAIGFFSFSALIILVCMVFTGHLYKNRYFKSQMRHSGEFDVKSLQKYISFKSNEGDKEVNLAVI